MKYEPGEGEREPECFSSPEERLIDGRKLSLGQGCPWQQKQGCLTFSEVQHRHGAFPHSTSPRLQLTTTK